MTPDDRPKDGGDRFPATRWSAVFGTRSADAEQRARSLEILIAAYWKPVYKYIRMKWNKTGEDAQDLTQEFFVRAMEKDYFAPYDPSRGRFRTFLRACLDGFLSNQHKAAHRLKRGGDAIHMPLEFERAEGEISAMEIPAPDDLDRYFDIEWTRSLFGLAVEALRSSCRERGKEIPFLLFERYDLDPPATGRPTYEALAGQFGLPVTQVTNHLSFARREFRRLLLEKLREITVNDEEFRLEARFLLGADPD